MIRSQPYYLATQPAGLTHGGLPTPAVHHSKRTETSARIKGFIQEKNFGLAMEEWKAFQSSGLKPNTHLLNLVLETYLGLEDLPGALSVLERMKVEKLHSNQMMYTKVISACGRLKKPMLALDLFKDMRMVGCRPDLVVYSTLIGVFADLQMRSHVEALLSMMKQEGLSPNGSICTRVMLMFSRLNELKAAEEILEGYLYEDTKIAPHHCNTILDIYSHHKLYSKAAAFFEYAIKKGLETTVETCNRAIHIYSKLHQPEKATEILLLMLRKGIRADVITYNTLIDAYLRNDDIKNAEIVLEYAKKSNLADEQAHARLKARHTKLKNAENRMPNQTYSNQGNKTVL